MTTDLAVRSTVGASEWGLMLAQAEELSRSDIIPAAYRRKPANVVVAALTGRAHGWAVLTAMRNGHVIEGTWGMKPEAMLGLVRAAGHSVTGGTTATGAKVHGKRADTGDEMDVEFTLEDAQRAGLAGKGTWKNYPQMMCYWRAVGLLCRMLFSDVTLGVHSVEELAGAIDEDGEPIEATMGPREPEPLSEANMALFRQACESEGLEPERVMDEAFGEGVRPAPLTDADLPAMRDAFKTLVNQRAQSEESAGAEGPAAHAPAGADDRPATRAQVGKIKEQYARLGVEDRLTQLSHTSQFLGGISLSSHNDLTWFQAQTLIELLLVTGEIG
jgi:hypothetical protein